MCAADVIHTPGLSARWGDLNCGSILGTVGFTESLILHQLQVQRNHEQQKTNTDSKKDNKFFKQKRPVGVNV